VYLPQGTTQAQAAAVVTAPVVDYAAGLELLDENNALIEDISAWLVPEGSSVELGSYRTIHRTCRLRLSYALDWGIARVRPYMTLTSAAGSFRADLGVFVLSTPSTTSGEDLKTWDVEGYDLLEVLSHPHGATYFVASGVSYLAAVASLCSVQGLTFVGQAAGDAPTLPSDRLWPIDPDTTTLNIINDLLSAAGYGAIYSDASGTLRAAPYQSPADRPVEWTYDADDESTVVGPVRELVADYFEAPNRWVFIVDDPEWGNPTEGAGIYTVINQSDGLTSIDARGRTINRVERREAANQGALESSGNRTIDADKRIALEIPGLTVGPNPLHGHFDVVQVTDAELEFDQKVVVRSWSLPLDGGDMQLDVRAV